MSRISEKEIPCRECGKSFSFQCWDSCNVSLDPELREKVLRLEIFQGTCPACGQTYTIHYPCLYHDMEKRFMVYFLPGHEGDTWSDMPASLIPLDGYTLRLESERNDFLERVLLLDAGVNDMAFEVLRWLSLPQVQEMLPEARQLYFIGRGDEDIKLQVIMGEQSMQAITLPISVYDLYEKVILDLDVEATIGADTFYRMTPRWLEENKVIDRLVEALGGG